MVLRVAAPVDVNALRAKLRQLLSNLLQPSDPIGIAVASGDVRRTATATVLVTVETEENLATSVSPTLSQQVANDPELVVLSSSVQDYNALGSGTDDDKATLSTPAIAAIAAIGAFCVLCVVVTTVVVVQRRRKLRVEINPMYESGMRFANPTYRNY